MISKDGKISELTERMKNMLLDRELSKPLSTALSAGSQYLHLVFADVTGFTALDDDTRRKMLSILRAMARPQVEACSGHLVNMEGDCVIAAFADVNDALLLAFNIQAHLNVEEQDVHIAIASGEVMVAQNTSLDGLDIDGDTVNFAARLLGMAQSGEVLAAADTAHDPDFDANRFKVQNIQRPLKKALGDKKAGDMIDCAAGP